MWLVIVARAPSRGMDGSAGATSYVRIRSWRLKTRNKIIEHTVSTRGYATLIQLRRKRCGLLSRSGAWCDLGMKSLNEGEDWKEALQSREGSQR